MKRSSIIVLSLSSALASVFIGNAALAQSDQAQHGNADASAKTTTPQEAPATGVDNAGVETTDSTKADDFVPAATDPDGVTDKVATGEVDQVPADQAATSNNKS